MPNSELSLLLVCVELCFAFLLMLLTNYKTTSYKPTCLLKFLELRLRWNEGK
jgi:hypothetical protein